MPEPKPEVRYDTEAIDFIDDAWDRFYDIWLGLAETHAFADKRNKVLKKDIKETVREAVESLVREVEHV